MESYRDNNENYKMKHWFKYLHGTRVTEGEIIHTKKDVRVEKTMKFPG